MPLCTLHLIALTPTSPNPQHRFLSTLKSANLSPLVTSRVIRWIILPTTFSLSPLLALNIHWDFLLILPGTDALPPPLQALIQHHWSITAGVPSRLVHGFQEKNEKLLRPGAEDGSVPRLSGTLETESQKTTTATTKPDSAQNLELSTELREWIREFSSGAGKEATGAVSMLNLLSFRPGMKASYLKYGAAFAERVGKAHGGDAKMVGGVTHVGGVPRVRDAEDGEGWDEVALAHYPSIKHFAEMLGDEEYQGANWEFRVPALKDTAILMTSEVAVGDGGEEKGGKARL